MSVCEDYIKKFAGDKLTDDEINSIYSRYDKTRLEFVTRGLTDNIDMRIADRLTKDALQKKMNAVVTKRSAIINRMKFNDILRTIETKKSEGFSPSKTIRMMIEGIQSNTEGARLHVDNLKNAYARKYLGGMHADLIKEVPSFFTQMKDPAFDKAIGKEMGELREGGTPGSSKNNDAMKAAKIMQQWKQVARLAYNKRGGFMGEIEGHVAQSHDEGLLLKAGVSKWVDHMMANLDLEKTFKGIDTSNTQELREVLARSYQQIVTGVKFTPQEIAPVSKGNSQSLVTKFSHDRVYHFKDHETQMAYHNLYGHGSITGSVVHGLSQMAKANSMMDVFGTNPEATFKHVVSSQISRLSKDIVKETNPAKIKQMQDHLQELNQGDLHAMINEMTGVANVPGRVGIAKVFNGIRAMLSMAHMGNSGVSSAIGDSFNMMGTGMYSGQHGLDALAPVLRAFESIPKEQRRDVAFRLGEGFEGLLGSVHAQAVDNGSTPGFFSKALTEYFKWVGVTGWTDHARQAFVRERAAWLGKNSDKEFKSLDPGLRDGLTRNGITEPEWNAIRNSKLEAVNGHNYIMPDNVRMVDEKHMQGVMAEELANIRSNIGVDEAKSPEAKAKREEKYKQAYERILDKNRDGLEMKMRNYFYDEANYGIVMPTAKSKRIARGAILGSSGTQPGSVYGEIAKSVMMYKTFTIANFDNLGRALQSGNGFQIAGQGVGALVKLIALNYVGGLMLTYTQDLMKGNWPPKNPLSADVLTRAMVSGGALGLYGDYLMNAVNSYHAGDGLVAGMMGPEVGSIGNLAYLPRAMFDKDGKLKKQGKMYEVLKTVQDWTPFGNLAIVKPTTDALIYDQLKEWSNPGYKAKKKETLTKLGQHNVFAQAAKQVYGR